MEEGLGIKREEPRNAHNRFAVYVLKGCDVVGHVPREFSKTLWYFVSSRGQDT